MSWLQALPLPLSLAPRVSRAPNFYLSLPLSSACHAGYILRDELIQLKMALDTVSHFFDAYRKGGKNGEQILQSVRQNVSSSFKKSSLGTKHNVNSSQNLLWEKCAQPNRKLYSLLLRFCIFCDCLIDFFVNL